MSDEAARIFQAIFHKVHNQGLSVREAFDAVMGDGAFERLAGQVYDSLRARVEEASRS